MHERKLRALDRLTADDNTDVVKASSPVLSTSDTIANYYCTLESSGGNPCEAEIQGAGGMRTKHPVIF